MTLIPAATAFSIDLLTLCSRLHPQMFTAGLNCLGNDCVQLHPVE